MTNEEVLKRKEGLVKQIEAGNKRMEELGRAQNQLAADLNALSGAIQDCEYWLKEMSQKEVKKDFKEDAPKEAKPAKA